ncbi:3'-5' exonuclease-like [Tasmannia lanceolata]|uniref:3'-5' exonuclease-like n=1 Tax=Tasmannia lanceolata TaxID=3420 RepID=UPI0040634868
MTTTRVTIQGVTITTTVANHTSLVDNYISELKSFFNFKSMKVVGFDVVWKANTSGGITNKVAILQLCVESRCYIFQLLYFDRMSQSLKSFLADPKITFVGVGIGGDVRKLERDYGLECRKYVELGKLAASVYGNPCLIGYSLVDLAREVVGLDIVKPSTVTQRNWNERLLTEEQVKYATIDAYVSFRIGKRLLTWF